VRIDRRLAVVAALTILLTGPATAIPAEGAGQEKSNEIEPARFSVATFNICWGNLNLPKVVAGIREAKADLVLLQETNAQSEVYLRRNLRAIYPNMYFRGHDGAYAAERFGILSKAPVGGLKFLRPKDGLFGAWRGQTNLAGRALQIVNVHLQPIIVDSRQGITGLLRSFAAMEQTHHREIEYIYQNLSPDVPTLVAGDFNSTSTFLAPSFLLAKGFVDSFASLTKNPDSHPTWHWLIGQAELSLRIDYIFHTRHVRTLESRILKSDASDHYLVVSRLQWISKGPDDPKPGPESEPNGKTDTGK
jgi:endonuclease/exonuclease/phosphatase family metal-dependent hydrolase